MLQIPLQALGFRASGFKKKSQALQNPKKLMSMPSRGCSCLGVLLKNQLWLFIGVSESPQNTKILNTPVWRCILVAVGLLGALRSLGLRVYKDCKGRILTVM